MRRHDGADMYFSIERHHPTHERVEKADDYYFNALARSAKRPPVPDNVQFDHTLSTRSIAPLSGSPTPVENVALVANPTILFDRSHIPHVS